MEDCVRETVGRCKEGCKLDLTSLKDPNEDNCGLEKFVLNS